MGIKRHIKHYQVETIIDSNGKEKKEICYTGMYLCPVYIEQEIRKQRNICLGFTIVMIAFFFLAAFLNTMGTRQIWIAIPFASLVLPFIYLVMGNISLFYWKEKLEQPLVENSKGRIEKTTIAIVILEVVVVITNIFFIVSKNFNGNLKTELIFIGSNIILLALALLEWKKMQYFKVKEWQS